MQGSTPVGARFIAPSARSVSLRLLIAFLLGLPLGPDPTFPEWLQWTIPVVVLVFAMLLSIQLDPNVRRGVITPERAVRASLFVLLLTMLMVAVMALLISAGSGFVGLALIPLGISLVATFTVGSSGMWWLALAYGLIAWLGASVHLLLGISLLSTTPVNTFGDIIFVLTLVEVIVGMVIAIPGALLGRLMHILLLGKTAVHPIV